VIGETGSPRLQFPTLERGADELERCLERGRALGLIEVFERPNALPTYRVPRLLAGLVVLPGDGEVLAKVGAEVLHRLWWESDYQCSEEQALEIHRLALVGKAGEIAVKIAALLTNWTVRSSRKINEFTRVSAPNVLHPSSRLTIAERLSMQGF
jgi:hypothetical protein